MFKHLIRALVLAGLLSIAIPAVLSAQAPDPDNQVTGFLTSKGYSVIEVGNFSDDKGVPQPNAVYVSMDAVGGDLDSQEMADQAIWGLTALRKYYPGAATLYSVPIYQRYGFFFPANASTFDQYLKQTLSASAFWSDVRGQVRIFDFVKKIYLSEKDWTALNQTDKDQTNKDYTHSPPNPVPTPVPGTPGQGAALRLEPSTTYLPTDGKTAVTLIGTLLDQNYVPLAKKALVFAYETAGQEVQDLGSKMTDANGTARVQTKGVADAESLLLRVGTESLNSQISIVVGPLPTTDADRARAIVQALTAQGYSDVDAEFYSQALATNEKLNIGIVQMRMKSKAMDREFFSQLSRGLGTTRTLFSTSGYLRSLLIYRDRGRDVVVFWNTQTAYWDQFVAGQMSESDFWRYLQYDGACIVRDEEHCDSIADKNFLDKNFGASGGKEARVPHTLESTLTKETWGDQWHGQEFVVLPGSTADGFALAELGGNATAVQIFQSPEFRTPLLEFKRGDNPDTLKHWQLAQGQYEFSVVASSAPATGKMTYVEHIPQ